MIQVFKPRYLISVGAKNRGSSPINDARAVLLFFGGFDRLEAAIEQQVVYDLEATRQKERHVHERCIRQQRSSGDRGKRCTRCPGNTQAPTFPVTPSVNPLLLQTITYRILYRYQYQVLSKGDFSRSPD